MMTQQNGMEQIPVVYYVKKKLNSWMNTVKTIRGVMTVEKEKYVRRSVLITKWKNNMIDNFINNGIVNTFKLITGKSTYEEIVSESNGPGGGTIFFIFPEDKPDNEDIDTMIDYFTSTEEYEKCALLIKLKK